MKHLKISIPDGYEIDKAQSTFENIVFKPTVTALPKTWIELNKINGYSIDGASRIEKLGDSVGCIDINKNVFATEEQAKASIALAQLSQLMQVYNDGWVPDWKDDNYKHNIEYYIDETIIETRCSYSSFLAFKTQETAKLFLENFKDLITNAKPLL
jgi:hypothetical protein